MGQLQDVGNVTTLAGYLEILDQCALLTGLYKYASDEARKRGSVPKYQVFNNALLTAYNALLTAYKGSSFVADRADTQTWGRWVESSVGAHLLSMADDLGYDVYYWRENSKEVDFIIVRNGEVTAIEVKSGRRGMNSGLPAFVDAFHPKRAFIVGTGGVSLEDFFSSDIEKIL